MSVSHKYIHILEESAMEYLKYYMIPIEYVYNINNVITITLYGLGESPVLTNWTFYPGNTFLRVNSLTLMLF